MDNKKKMKAMIKQMQSVIALVIIFVVASTICIRKTGICNWWK